MNNKDRALKNATDCMESTKLADVISLWVAELDAAEARGRATWAEEIRVMAATLEGKVREETINNCIAALEANGHPPHTSMAFPIGVLRNLLDDTKEKSDG